MNDIPKQKSISDTMGLFDNPLLIFPKKKLLDFLVQFIT